MAVDLKDHPGLNPQYFEQKARREQALAYNRANPFMPPLPVPPQPNKYVPHVGAKQRAKTANWPDGPLDRAAERRGSK